MNTLSPPLPRPAREKPEPTNIRLPRKLKRAGAQCAVDRYGWTFTKMVRALIEKEVSHKRGVVNARLK
jgi:hypothetical protein